VSGHVVCWLHHGDIQDVTVHVHVPGCVPAAQLCECTLLWRVWGFARLLQPDASALLARELPPGPDWGCAAAAGVVSSLHT
jgi:hypothetical protein